MTKAELMECSEATLGRLAQMIQDEAARRGVTIEAVPVHPGNVPGGRPTPAVVRLLRRLPTLSPADIARMNTLLDAWGKTSPPPDPPAPFA